MAQSAGTVIGISGDCFVVSGGSRTALRLGLAVQVGDILDVAAPAKLKLRMADGSIISVAAGTQMTIRAYAVDAAGQRQDASSVARAGIVARRRGSGRPGRQGSRSIPPSAPPRCARRTGLSRRSPASMQAGVLTGSIVMTSGATGRERHDSGTLGGAARSRAQPGAAARVEPGGVRCGHRPHRSALKRARIALIEASRGRAAPAKPGWRCAIALGVMLGLAYWAPGAFRDLETASLDLRFRIRGALPPGPEIAVVLVDEASLSRLGRWPLSRRLYAKAVEILDRAGARVIAFDLLFAEPEEPVAASIARGGAGGRRAARANRRTRRFASTLARIAEDEPDADFAASLARERQGAAAGRVSLV